MKELNEAIIRELMLRLQAAQEGAYSCEETFALLDEYVEMAVSKQAAEALMPLVRNHIEMCPCCHEEFEVLLRILESEA